MSATTATLPVPVPAATQAVLAELLQLGIGIARVTAEFAAVERRAVAALAEAAEAATAAVLAPHPAFAHAARAGADADVSDAARAAVSVRLATINTAFDKVSRALRRTAALQNRLLNGGAYPWPGRSPAARPPNSAARPANDAERPERPDAPDDGNDWVNEIAGQTDAQVLRAIRRDLGVPEPPEPPSNSLAAPPETALNAGQTAKPAPARPTAARAAPDRPPGPELPRGRKPPQTAKPARTPDPPKPDT